MIFSIDYFLERWEGKEGERKGERERNTDVRETHPLAISASAQPRVWEQTRNQGTCPGMGIKPKTLWCTDQHSNH